MEDTRLYRKVGRRYVEAGEQFTGFPSPGVWVVVEKPGCKSSSNIMKVGDIQNPAPLAALHQHHDEVCTALLNFFEEYHNKKPNFSPSVSAIVHAVYMATCKAEERRVAGVQLQTPVSGTAPRRDNVTAWLNDRKRDVLFEQAKKLELKAANNYYMFRPDEEEHVAWEDLREEDRNRYRDQVRAR